MVKPFNVSLLHAQYANETPEEKAARCAENKARTERMLSSWHRFEQKYPDLAKRMVC